MKINKQFIISLICSILTILVIHFLGDLKNFITISLLILIILLHAIILFYHFNYLKNYEDINQTLEELINDKLDRNIITKYVSQQKLNANLNRLVKKIDKLVFTKEENELIMQILTNNITSPIIYIDRDGKIRYANHEFINSFKVNIEINDIYEKLRIQSIYKFIDDAFIFETQATDILQIDEKYYYVNAIPINNNLNNQLSFIGILFIFNDITELKKYENLQREFLADASHELKTPISAIKVASEILLNGETHPKATLIEFLKIIKNENERMERIVSDILLISRIENDKSLIRIEKVNLTSLVKQVVKILEIRIRAKNQDIKLTLEDDIVIYGDYERLKHVFLNLLLNAINYTNENKKIYITLNQAKEHVIVSIRDEGIGIDEKSLPHIFERFYRVDKARSRDTGGTGLGLAIVKSILDIHKAKIEVKSKLNEGSEFIIYFNN